MAILVNLISRASLKNNWHKRKREGEKDRVREEKGVKEKGGSKKEIKKRER